MRIFSKIQPYDLRKVPIFNRLDEDVSCTYPSTSFSMSTPIMTERRFMKVDQLINKKRNYTKHALTNSRTLNVEFEFKRENST